MRKPERLFVIIIAGPTGVGKTTLSKMLSRYYDCAYLSEDDIAKEIFPHEYKNIEDYPDKVEIIARELLERAKEIGSLRVSRSYRLFPPGLQTRQLI